MKKIFLKVAALSMLSVTALVQASCSTSAAPYYNKRSQSVNAMLELVGWQQHINRCGMDSTWGSFYIAPEYEQTWGSCNIAQCLFGPALTTSTTTGSTVTTTGCCDSDCGGCGSCDSCCGGCGSQLVVSGSAVADRGAQDWLADYFFLPRDFRSTISFCPKIQSVNVDLNFFLGLDELTEGLWFRIHAPITWTRWQLNFNETITAAGTNANTVAGGNYPEGYFSNLAIATTDLRTNASDFFTGQTKAVPSTNDDTGLSLGAVTMQPLRYSKWLTCGSSCNSETRLSDIEMALGYNFVCNEDGHFGLGIRASAPTGNRPTGQFLFEPIVGSGKHWKLGGMLTSHFLFWRSEDQESTFGFWLDANVQHWFNACQTRVFDLAGKPNSRYALAQRMQTTDNAVGTLGEPPYHLTTPAAGYEWALEFAPVANLTAARVKVNVDVEGDLVMKFAYTSRSGFQVDFGYEFWATSCENICLQSRCQPFTDTSWALKGDASVVGFGGNGTAAPPTDAPVLLGASESLADITGGTNFPDSATFRNVSIDNPVLADSPNGIDVNNIPTTSDFSPALAEAQTNSSSTVVFIRNVDIGYADAQTKGLSNKVFAHFSYTWNDNEDWLPFLGVGASAEFGQNCGSGCGDCGGCGSCDSCCTTSTVTPTVTSSSCCSDSCSSCCHECAVSQWAVWAKFGVSFQ